MSDFNANWPDVRIGDVYFVIGQPGSPTRRDWARIGKTQWFQGLTGNTDHPIPEIALRDLYNEHCFRKGQEPGWVKHLSASMRHEMHYGWLTGDYFEPFGILPHRRDLGFAFAVKSDGMVHDVCIALNVFRLDGIKQLGFLHDPVVNNDGADIGLAMRFHHTRFMHSLLVMATVSLIGKQVGLSEYEIKHLQIAALTHDVLTPAGGDSVKPIDFAGFDEDAHYAEVFHNNPEWEQVRNQYELDEALLTSIVGGQGVLGQLLDIADKTSYVAHDLDAFLMMTDPRKYSWIVPPQGLLDIWNLREAIEPETCKLWDKVRIIDGQVVITDPRRLAGFLKLRALMFRHLYQNPRARYREQMLSVLILEPFYHEGVVTREQLLKMGDYELEQLLGQLTGLPDFRIEMSHTWHAPDIESFPDLEHALARLRAIAHVKPKTLFMLEVFPQPSKKAVWYLVLDGRKEVRPLAEAFPKLATDILDSGVDHEPAKLYILSQEKTRRIIPKQLHRKLRARQRVQFSLE